MSKPVRSNVETFNDGNLTNAINATQSPIPIASIRSQWPVKTQIHTMNMESENDRSSAPVNRPHTPNDILFPSEHGRIMY